MFLVGHAAVAFLLGYLISRKFAVTGSVSFAIVMLIATLPDIDVVTQAMGVMPHKTFTHSLIISGAAGATIFLVAKIGFKQGSIVALIYSLAYSQHLVGDAIIGTLNVASPFGYLPVGLGIDYGSVGHEIIEILLLAPAAAVTVGISFGSSKGRSASLLLRSHRVDKVAYVLLILSFVVSFGYLLYSIGSQPRLSIVTSLELALFALLHIAGIAWVSFIVLASRQYAAAFV